MLMLALSTTFSLSSCSKDDDDSSSNPIVGTWTTTNYGEVSTITFNSNGTCTYKNVDGGYVETDSGKYTVSGSKLSIWWESERKYWEEDGPWTTTFVITGNTMKTSEGGGTTWTRK